MSIPIISIEGFISWVERQNLDTTYLYTDAKDCIIQRYLVARGYTTPDISFNSDQLREMGFGEIAHANIHGKTIVDPGKTYRRALASAKEQLAKKYANV